MFVGVIVSWPIALFVFFVGTRIGRAISLILFVMVLWNMATDSHSETLTCTEWQGIRTCASNDGYVSHETRWQGITSHWDNQDGHPDKDPDHDRR